MSMHLNILCAILV